MMGLPDVASSGARPAARPRAVQASPRRKGGPEQRQGWRPQVSDQTTPTVEEPEVERADPDLQHAYNMGTDVHLRYTDLATRPVMWDAPEFKRPSMKQTLGEARQLLAGTVDFSDEDWAVLSGQAAKELQGDLGRAGLRWNTNVQADGVHLRKMVEQLTSSNAPASTFAKKALGCMEQNPGWSFQQKKRLLSRLVANV